MTSTLTDKDWEILLRRIPLGKCVPFLGAGACYGALPLGAEIAANGLSGSTIRCPTTETWCGFRNSWLSSTT